MANEIDWDKPPTQLETATRKSIETGVPIIRKDTVLAPAYTPPQQEETILPALGGLAGTVLGTMFIKNPAAGATAGKAFVGSLFPSLAGSTLGTAAGTAAERTLAGDLFTTEGGKQMLGNLLENAAWDVGGNLVFSLAGKTYKVGKDIVSKFKGQTLDPAQDARNAAQAYLSQRGATLSLGQLQQTPGILQAETVIRGGTGAKAFAEQQAGVSKAIQEGLDDVRSTLNTSPAFNQALATDEPLSRAVGENFQNLISTARNDFKDTYRPFYDSLTKDYGVYINMRPIKAEAKAELERIVKAKGVGSSADRAEVLNDILKQNDFVEFGVAHDIRSALNGAANDLAQPGKNATSKQAAYTKYANKVDQQMSDAVQFAASNKGQRDWIAKHGYDYVETPEAGALLVTGPAGFNQGVQRTQLAKDLVLKYNQVTEAYKAGMNGLYNETINTAMTKAPSKVGAYLADLSESEKFTDLFKAVSQVDKYAKTAGSTGAQAVEDVRAGFLNTILNTPEKARNFATKLKEDDELRRAFYKMYRNQAPQLKEILNAADIGLESTGTVASFLRTRIAGTGIQATGGILGYLALPSEVQDRLKEQLPTAGITAGALLLTPALMARVATNKNAADALAGLSKYKEGTKISGAVAAKLVDQLNKSGIISSEYVTEIDNIFNRPQEQPTVTKPAEINWDIGPQ